ncbi:MAG: DNA topoisomerase IV subunit A [Aquiluna sp.]|nr:DNA topoisomerase IV subunit A [Aquiluna sp.]
MTDSSERIVDIDVSEEMQESFLEYSYSVIYSRALPDARDGLKPVQRRIIYQMGEMGLRSDKGHVKCARVTGEVMGKLHPHGDGAIYDALVRMSQNFSLRLPLIDGHGNFGSLDDGPAAARYTEAKLAAAAEALNQSLDEDVVDFTPNYDAQLMEPSVLPAAFPNLLVNGASGIAVGMATNMPPHNLNEVVSALHLIIDKPDATLQQIMEVLPGPDLPSGATALVGEGLRDAYETGRGTFRTRAKIEVETVAPRRTGLVVTELPYLVGPERVIDKIRDAVGAKKLEGIHNVVDLTDRENGLRLVIELKTGFDPQSVIEALYRLTPLEESFGVNNVALVDGRPQQMPLKALLEVYLEHRISVTKRRSKNRLDRRLARLHLLDGLAKAVVNIDEVIEVIRSSDTAEAARSKLEQVFDLSQLQSEYILELRLRRLTRFSIIELETEADTLRKEIEELSTLLESEKLVRKLVATELSKVAEEFGTPRRTVLIDSEGMQISRKPVQVAQIEDEPVLVALNGIGGIYRTGSQIEAQPPLAIETTMRSDIALFTTKGRAIRIHVSDLPGGSAKTPFAAVEADKFLGLVGEEVIGVANWLTTDTFAVGTQNGTVKRFQGPLPDRDDVFFMSLKDDDRCLAVTSSHDGSELFFVTNSGNILIFSADAVRPQGLPAAGMQGISTNSSRAIAFGAVLDSGLLVTASNSSQSLGSTDPGSIKLTPLIEYPRKGRATQGVRCHRFLKSEDQLYFAGVASEIPTVVNFDGTPISLPEIDQRRDSSGTAAPDYIAFSF